MKNLLNTIAVICLIIWAIGFLAYNATGIIHLLLLIAVIAWLISIISPKE